MKQNRRDFLKRSGLLAGSALTMSYPAKLFQQKEVGKWNLLSNHIQMENCSE